MMTQKREWLKNDTFELISIYQSKPVLWDITSKYYKSRIKKRHAWIEIAKHFQTTCEEIYRKIHNLRNQFNSEHKKMKMMKAEDESFELSVSKWPYYDALSFVQKSISIRATKIKQLAEENCNIDHPEYVFSSQTLNEDAVDEHLDEKNYFEIHNSNDVNDADHLPRKVETISNQNDPLIESRHSPHVLTTNQEEDQYTIFGNYIASEIRHLSSEYLRKKLKRRIQQIMFEISEEEERLFAPNQ